MEAVSTLTGYRMPDPVFVFGKGMSGSTSAMISMGPADLNRDLGYPRSKSELIPLLLTDGELDKPKRQVYEELIQGSERFYGLARILKIRVPSLDEIAHINLLDYSDPIKLDELVFKSREKDIAITLINDPSWKSIVKATYDYHGLPSQTLSSRILGKASKKIRDQTELRQYQSYLKNLAIEIYAKCKGIPWVLARPLTRRYFIGVAWTPLREHYVFALVVFDSRGTPLYEKSVIRIFQRSIRDFKSCNVSVIGEALRQIESDGFKVTLHYHGDIFGLEDVLKRTLSEHCQEWVALSVQRPKHPSFRLYRQSSKDNLSEKGIYVPLDGRQCLISTTGLPHFSVRGTPQNLHCESISELDRDQMLQEAECVYHLAQLNWAYLRGHHRLPVTTLLTSNIATGIRDAYYKREQLGLLTSLTPEAKPWSFW